VRVYIYGFKYFFVGDELVNGVAEVLVPDFVVRVLSLVGECLSRNAIFVLLVGGVVVRNFVADVFQGLAFGVVDGFDLDVAVFYVVVSYALVQHTTELYVFDFNVAIDRCKSIFEPCEMVAKE
jgi:hypothetical protein